MKLHKSVLLFGASALLLAACSDESADTEETAVEEPETEEVSTDTSGEEVEETTDEVEETEETENSFDGQTITTQDVTIEITDHKVLQPGEGNNHGDVPILGFWYDTTVHEGVTETEYDPMVWIMITKAIQDNDPDVVNELNVGTLPDEAHLDSQMQTIKPGGTVSSSVSYELDDLETPVELIVENIVTGEVYGSHTYEIE
jgi:hypothetical protein